MGLIRFASNYTLIFIVLKQGSALYCTSKVSLIYLFISPLLDFSKVIRIFAFEYSNEMATFVNTIYLHFIGLNLSLLFKQGKTNLL